MSCAGLEIDRHAGHAGDSSLSRAMMVAIFALRWSRGFSVMASRPALGVALSGLTPITDTTPVTSGSVRMTVFHLLLPALHFGERDVGAGLGHRGDQAGVLQAAESPSA